MKLPKQEVFQRGPQTETKNIRTNNSTLLAPQSWIMLNSDESKGL